MSGPSSINSSPGQIPNIFSSALVFLDGINLSYCKSQAFDLFKIERQLHINFGEICGFFENRCQMVHGLEDDFHLQVRGEGGVGVPAGGVVRPQLELHVLPVLLRLHPLEVEEVLIDGGLGGVGVENPVGGEGAVLLYV